MKIQVEAAKITYFLLVLVAMTTTASSKSTCPFDYAYHFGDGLTDIGNSILVRPYMRIPPGKMPYGETYPGHPTGRWCDGLVDFDFTAIDFGIPNIVPYLAMNQSKADEYDGVIFSVGRSTVLDREFFEKEGIKIPYYAVPLSQQFKWFLHHLKAAKIDVKKKLANSLVLMGDIEGNDIGYALTQGKWIEDVLSYVPKITEAIINTSREIIKLGATRVIIPGNVPLGCYPYILTALKTHDRSAYDEIGCLKKVNDFIILKNAYLDKAIYDLQAEFPNVEIFPGPMYPTMMELIRGQSVIGSNGINRALKSCCGIGGDYNYNSKRLCGSHGVPVCRNPDDYIFWDGMHYTTQTQWEAEQIAVQPALINLGCTPLPSAFSRYTRSKINIDDKIIRIDEKISIDDKTANLASY